MDEIWERAVEAALDGQTDVASVRSLTLDGAVKCLHGRLPQPSLFEKFHSLQHFSIANIGVSSLEQFPHLRNLQRLILSDNRIAGGLEFLVEAGLGSLRDLDLSNNRISDINDLRPLAELRLDSLDLYECPVTRVKDYRAQVFGLIRSLKYLDKMDVDENERPESEDEEEDEEEEDDPGSGEVDGEDHPFKLNNGDQAGMEGVVDVDEDEESDADEEETEIPRVVDGLSRGGRDSHPHPNGFGVVAVDGEDDNDEGEEDDDLVEVYEDDEGEDEDVVEVHEIDDSEEEDGVEEDEDEDEDEDEEEEVNNDERDFGEAGGTGRLTSAEGEIDGHEQGEDDTDEDDNGETGEEEQAVEEDGDFDDEDEEEDYDNGYLVQPVGRAEPQTGGSDLDPGDEDEDPEIEEDLEEEDDEENLDGEIQELPSSSSDKRKRNEDSQKDDDDDMLPFSKSSKNH
ncbi:acidic leucine-rich nuclear phosphoprotein 32-related protein-like [Primulina eburnea]|uniref:acidic leucine-rich nuclear phosphoprotein 32-related protein-like n=1 Tax=Primulina eburnea TaxID=1245227 RepID=UPI003C6C1ADF